MTKTVDLDDGDYLKLWMYFQDRADDIKEAMFKTVTWTVGYAAVILAFIFTTLVNFNPDKSTVRLSWLVMSSAIAGLAICAYTFFALREAGKHIKRNWERADRCEEHVNNLGVIFRGKKGEGGEGDGGEKALSRKIKKFFSRIWNQLGIIVSLFSGAFAFILVWQLARVMG